MKRLKRVNINISDHYFHILRNHIWIEQKLKLYLHYQKIDRKIFKSFIFPVSILGEKSDKIFIFIKIINAIIYNTNFCIFFTRIVFISFLKIHLLFTSLFPPKLNPELSTLISMMIKNVYHRIDVAGMYAYLSCLSTLVTKKTYRKCWVFFICSRQILVEYEHVCSLIRCDEIQRRICLRMARILKRRYCLIGISFHNIWSNVPFCLYSNENIMVA